MSAALAKSRDESEAGERNPVWPALVNVYHEQGYDAGYSRGASDVLATALEATEEFLRARGQTDVDARQLLYDFTEFLEARLRKSQRGDDDHSVIDGLGI